MWLGDVQTCDKWNVQSCAVSRRLGLSGYHLCLVSRVAPISGAADKDVAHLPLSPFASFSQTVVPKQLVLSFRHFSLVSSLLSAAPPLYFGLALVEAWRGLGCHVWARELKHSK